MVQMTLSRSTHARCVRFKSPLLSGCGTSSSTSSIYTLGDALWRQADTNFFTPFTTPPTTRPASVLFSPLYSDIYGIIQAQHAHIQQASKIGKDAKIASFRQSRLHLRKRFTEIGAEKMSEVTCVTCSARRIQRHQFLLSLSLFLSLFSSVSANLASSQGEMCSKRHAIRREQRAIRLLSDENRHTCAYVGPPDNYSSSTKESLLRDALYRRG